MPIFGEGFFLLNSRESYNYGFVQALQETDWNVIMMIAGTMGTVYLFIESKMPQLMSDVLISKMPNVKWVVVALSLFAGIVSAFVDNVATVLMIAPVALNIAKKLNINPVAMIISIAVSSNLQGAATLVGDTTSIMLGGALDIRKIAVGIVGAILLLVGNYLPKMDYIKNYDVDTEPARKINRFIGYETIGMGILFFVSIFLPPQASVVCLFLFIPYVILAVWYGIRTAKTHKKGM